MDDNYIIGFNLLKQCLFGVGYFAGSWSLCTGPFSVEIHPRNWRTKKQWFSFYTEF